MALTKFQYIYIYIYIYIIRNKSSSLNYNWGGWESNWTSFHEICRCYHRDTASRTLKWVVKDNKYKRYQIKSMKSWISKFEINLQKVWNLLSLTIDLANQVINQCLFALLRLCTYDTKHYKHGINVLLLCTRS